MNFNPDSSKRFNHIDWWLDALFHLYLVMLLSVMLYHCCYLRNWALLKRCTKYQRVLKFSCIHWTPKVHTICCKKNLQAIKSSLYLPASSCRNMLHLCSSLNLFTAGVALMRQRKKVQSKLRRRLFKGGVWAWTSLFSEAFSPWPKIYKYFSFILFFAF